nr:RNA-directed DNA polymerase, eukaryota, reverse transcriptase zinc-binding domain protein [Tanacetum cinerariifolium]
MILRHELDEAQKALDSDPKNTELREEEAAYLNAFQDALLMEERLFLQKAKIDWPKLGDANTAYFHKVVKSQASRNRIDSITNSNGDYVDGDQEIRDAMFSFADNKASGPDGYTFAFFKEAWGIISADICRAIREFFTNGILLKELNHTIIALIPELKDSLSELVSLNQSAFVPGRLPMQNQGGFSPTATNLGSNKVLISRRLSMKRLISRLHSVAMHLEWSLRTLHVKSVAEFQKLYCSENRSKKPTQKIPPKLPRRSQKANTFSF